MLANLIRTVIFFGGIFAFCVLLVALSNVQVRRTGRKIMRILADGEERSSLELRQRLGATVYVALAELEEDARIVGRLGETAPERGGRPRRYYRIAPGTTP